jgi:hypothetical protein
VGHVVMKWTTFFQLHFGIVIASGAIHMMLHYWRTNDATSRKLVMMYWCTLLVGFSFWLLDLQ